MEMQLLKKKKTMRISSQISFPAGGGDGLCGKATRPIFVSFSYQRCPRLLSIENSTLDPATVAPPSCCMYLHGGVLTVVCFLSFATMKRISTPKYHSRYLGLKSITDLRIRTMMHGTYLSIISRLHILQDNLRPISIYDEVKQSAHPEHLIILPKGTKRTRIQIANVN